MNIIRLNQAIITVLYEQFAKMANKAISQKQPYETSAKYWSLAQNVVSQLADIPTIYEAFMQR